MVSKWTTWHNAGSTTWHPSQSWLAGRLVIFFGDYETCKSESSLFSISSSAIHYEFLEKKNGWWCGALFPCLFHIQKKTYDLWKFQLQIITSKDAFFSNPLDALRCDMLHEKKTLEHINWSFFVPWLQQGNILYMPKDLISVRPDMSYLHVVCHQMNFVLICIKNNSVWKLQRTEEWTNTE